MDRHRHTKGGLGRFPGEFTNPSSPFAKLSTVGGPVDVHPKIAQDFTVLGWVLGRWSPFGEGIASFSVIRGGYPTVGCASLLDADGVEVD